MQEWPQHTVRDKEAEYVGRIQSDKLRHNLTETTEIKLQPIRPIFMAGTWVDHERTSQVFTNPAEITQQRLLYMNGAT